MSNECVHQWSKVWSAGQATWRCMDCNLQQPVGFGCEHTWVAMLGPFAGDECCRQCGTIRMIEVPDLRDRPAVEEWLSA